MTTLVESLEAKERVKKWIFDPLNGRGEPPRGWTKESLLADYVLALGKFPAAVLERASAKAREGRTRPTWPLAAEYAVACKALMADEPPPERDDGNMRGVLERTAKAYAYVEARMAADGHALWWKAKAAGMYAVDEFEKWLWESACGCLREGRDPYVSGASVEAKLSGLAETSREIEEKWARHPHNPARGTAMQAPLRNAVSAAREAMEQL